MLLRRNVFGMSGAAGGFARTIPSPTGGFAPAPAVTRVPAAFRLTVSENARKTAEEQAAADKAAYDTVHAAMYAFTHGGAPLPPKSDTSPSPTPNVPSFTLAPTPPSTYAAMATGDAGSYTLPDGTVVSSAPEGLLAKFGAMSIFGKLAVVGAIGGVGYLGYRMFFKGGAAGALSKSPQPV